MVLRAIMILLAPIAITLAYGFLHELLHYLAAKLAGCYAKFVLSSDGILVSPGLIVKGECDRYEAVILYSPYMLNITMILAWVFGRNNMFLAILATIGIATLPNILLEKEENRAKLAMYIRSSYTRVVGEFR